MAGSDDGNPLEQLVDVMLYAPIGLLYEYQDVLPQLVKRGKSQVQLARVMAQFAANRSQDDPGGAVADATSLASSLVAKVVTDLGAQLGLAPSPPPEDGGTAAAAPAASAVDEAGSGAAGRDPVADGAGADDPTEEAAPLPIAGYDGLTAREAIPLLDDLNDEQRARIRAHEEANRNRKTVLAKLDRLVS